MPNPLLTAAIDAASGGRDLSQQQAADVLAEIMAGRASEVEVAGLLIALRAKGETVAELAGLASTMRRFAEPVRVDVDGLLDTAGTGGGRPTFNVSTTAALIAAGAGCTVAKHGNRSATGSCGSADVLEALGARIDLAPAAVARCIEELGFGFMFAPAHHPATRWVVPVRKQLGVRTVFNLLGPLTNPANASRQLIGVSDRGCLEVVAGALRLLGVTRALVVCGEDGVDELSIAAASDVVELDDGAISRYRVTPEDFGLERAGADALGAGSPSENARITLAVLGGERGPARDMALLNAGAAIYVAGCATTLAGGVRLATQAVDDRAARRALDAFVARTRELAGP